MIYFLSTVYEFASTITTKLTSAENVGNVSRRSVNLHTYGAVRSRSASVSPPPLSRYTYSADPFPSHNCRVANNLIQINCISQKYSQLPLSKQLPQFLHHYN